MILAKLWKALPLLFSANHYLAQSWGFPRNVGQRQERCTRAYYKLRIHCAKLMIDSFDTERELYHYINSNGNVRKTRRRWEETQAQLILTSSAQSGFSMSSGTKRIFDIGNGLNGLQHDKYKVEK